MKRFLGLILFPLVLALTGCWDNKDINKRAMPVAMGISKGSRQAYQVSFRIPEPRLGAMKIHSVEAEAATISQAIEQIRMKMENSIDLLHLKLILISDELAKESVNEIVEYSMQSSAIQSKAWMAIVNGNMSELMQAQNEDGEEAGQGFYDFFSKQAGWTPHISTATVWESFKGMYAYTSDIAIPVLAKGKDTMFQYKGSAVMHKDKMVDLITPNETLLYNIFRDKYSGAHMEVMSHASVIVLKAGVNIRTEWKPDEPKAGSVLKMTVTIEEMKPAATKAVIETELRQLLQERFRLLVDKLQRRRSDLLGYGQHFRERMTEEQLGNWRDDIYPHLRTDMQVDIMIRNGGSLKTSRDRSVLGRWPNIPAGLGLRSSSPYFQ